MSDVLNVLVLSQQDEKYTLVLFFSNPACDFRCKKQIVLLVYKGFSEIPNDI